MDSSSEFYHQKLISRVSKDVVYWDGKILPDATAGSGMVNRLTIYMTGTNIPWKGDYTQLLGVLQFHGKGTGEAQAEAVVSAL